MVSLVPPRHPAWVTAVCVVVALLSGVAVAAQTRVNSELASRIDSGLVAALISFGTGFAIMLIVTAFSPAARRGLVSVVAGVRERRMPWIWLAAGLAGAFMVLTQGLVGATLGVALFSVGIVAGQTVSGLLVDRRGVGTMPPKPITVFRALGALLALAAVIYAGWSQFSIGFDVWMLVLPFTGGVVIAWQQAFNGQIKEFSGSAITPTVINFAVGGAALALAVLISAPFAGLPTSYPSDPVVYLGGVIGSLFLLGAAIIVRYLGVFVLGLGMIAGQLLGSLLLDVVVPAEGHELSIPTVVATIMTLVAVLLSSVRPRATRES